MAGQPQRTVQETAVLSKLDIAKNWLPRYTGMPLDRFGEWILLTNFGDYVERFAEQFNCDLFGEGKPMQSATNAAGVSIIKFGIGSPNAAIIMDLLTAVDTKGALFLGKCGGLKTTTEIGHFILPIAAIRGEGTSDDYFPPEVPALPSFKLHKFVSERIVDRGLEYRTGVVYTTNRRVWEHDQDFLKKLHECTAIAIDMETATVFIVGHKNQIARGALLLVSDLPFTAEGVKTEESDKQVSATWTDMHLQIGIDAMTHIEKQGEKIKHFQY